MIKKFPAIAIFGAVCLVCSFLFAKQAGAVSTYTATDVAKHNIPADCWMSYENKVYDITEYLRTHETKYYFIDSWCGTDMTQAYNTKDGQGVDHKSSTTTGILPGYYIGDLVATAQVTATPATTASLETTATPAASVNPATSYATPTTATGTQTQSITPTPVTSGSSGKTPTNPYNFWTPFILINILLWGNYYLSKTNFWKKNFNPLTYRMIWNTMLIISLIPSAVFGLFLILSYSFPELRKIDFDFLYWHVEGSIAFTFIVLAHLILRLKMYFMQVKNGLHKTNSDTSRAIS